ncbi:MAG: OmpH family outer membrane protein [Phycisphaerae bacterium]|jgi:Skp family chaperone for outer membrane proteins|nr:OmpH family outer membrane protein [Phycisphaerae bacterium]MDP7287279.1 OmpH family outer membrane protein [Phycisphaerae bacterium]
MKSSQFILLLVAVALGGLGIVTHLDAQGGAATGAVAVCNVVEILNNCQKAKDLTAELNKERGRIESEVKKRTEAIDNLNKELQLLTVGSAEFEQRFAESQRLVINREAWLKFEQSKAMRKHQKLTREMYVEVQKAVGVVAKSRGFKVVLHQQRGKLRGTNTNEMRAEISQRKVVFSDQSVDITAGVLSSLNAAYRAKP